MRANLSQTAFSLDGDEISWSEVIFWSVLYAAGIAPFTTVIVLVSFFAE